MGGVYATSSWQLSKACDQSFVDRHFSWSLPWRDSCFGWRSYHIISIPTACCLQFTDGNCSLPISGCSRQRGWGRPAGARRRVAHRLIHAPCYDGDRVRARRHVASFVSFFERQKKKPWLIKCFEKWLTVNLCKVVRYNCIDFLAIWDDPVEENMGEEDFEIHVKKKSTGYRTLGSLSSAME